MPEINFTLRVQDQATRDVERVVNKMVADLQRVSQAMNGALGAAGSATLSSSPLQPAGALGSGSQVQGLAESRTAPLGTAPLGNTGGAAAALASFQSEQAAFVATPRYGTPRFNRGYGFGGVEYDPDRRLRPVDRGLSRFLQTHGQTLRYDKGEADADPTADPYHTVNLPHRRMRLAGAANMWIRDPDPSRPDNYIWQGDTVASRAGGFLARTASTIGLAPAGAGGGSGGGFLGWSGSYNGSGRYRPGLRDYGTDMVGKMASIAGVGFGLDYAAKQVAGGVDANITHTIDLGNLQKRLGAYGGSQDAFYNSVFATGRNFGYTNDEMAALANQYGSVVGRISRDYPQGDANAPTSFGNTTGVITNLNKVAGDISKTFQTKDIGKLGDALGHMMGAANDFGDVVTKAKQTVGSRLGTFDLNAKRTATAESTANHALTGPREQSLMVQLSGVERFAAGFGIDASSAANIFGTATQQGIINSSDARQTQRQLAASIASASEQGGMSGRVEEMTKALSDLVSNVEQTTVTAPSANTILAQMAALGASGQRGLQGERGAGLLAMANQQISTLGGGNLPAKIFLDQAITRGRKARGQATDYLSVMYQAEGGLGDANNMKDLLAAGLRETHGVLPSATSPGGLAAANVFKNEFGFASMRQAIAFVPTMIKNGQLSDKAISGFAGLLAGSGKTADDITNQSVLPLLGRIAAGGNLTAIAHEAAQRNIDVKGYKGAQDLFDKIIAGQASDKSRSAGMSPSDALKSDVDLINKQMEALAKGIQPVTQELKKNEDKLIKASLLLTPVLAVLENPALIGPGIVAAFATIAVKIGPELIQGFKDKVFDKFSGLIDGLDEIIERLPGGPGPEKPGPAPAPNQPPGAPGHVTTNAKGVPVSNHSAGTGGMAWAAFPLGSDGPAGNWPRFSDKATMTHDTDLGVPFGTPVALGMKAVYQGYKHQPWGYEEDFTGPGGAKMSFLHLSALSQAMADPKNVGKTFNPTDYIGNSGIMPKDWAAHEFLGMPYKPGLFGSLSASQQSTVNKDNIAHLCIVTDAAGYKYLVDARNVMATTVNGQFPHGAAGQGRVPQYTVSNTRGGVDSVGPQLAHMYQMASRASGVPTALLLAQGARESDFHNVANKARTSFGLAQWDFSTPANITNAESYLLGSDKGGNPLTRLARAKQAAMTPAIAIQAQAYYLRDLIAANGGDAQAGLSAYNNSSTYGAAVYAASQHIGTTYVAGGGGTVSPTALASALRIQIDPIQVQVTHPDGSVSKHSVGAKGSMIHPAAGSKNKPGAKRKH